MRSTWYKESVPDIYDLYSALFVTYQEATNGSINIEVNMDTQATSSLENGICTIDPKDEKSSPTPLSAPAAEDTPERESDKMNPLAPWFQCANCFFLNFISWGFVSSFGMEYLIIYQSQLY